MGSNHPPCGTDWDGAPTSPCLCGQGRRDAILRPNAKRHFLTMDDRVDLPAPDKMRGEKSERKTHRSDFGRLEVKLLRVVNAFIKGRPIDLHHLGASNFRCRGICVSWRSWGLTAPERHEKTVESVVAGRH